jgi:hypothetical protein
LAPRTLKHRPKTLKPPKSNKTSTIPKTQDPTQTKKKKKKPLAFPNSPKPYPNS